VAASGTGDILEDTMNILMTGASGLVGTALVTELARQDRTIYRLVRPGAAKPTKNSPNVLDLPWNPKTGDISFDGIQRERKFENADAVINLAGAPVVEGRWTPERKALLRSSRVNTTRGLVTALTNLSKRPRVMISASAIGYYGNRGDELLTESSEGGNDFLADLAKEWEGEAKQAEGLGVRVVLLRLGIVLAKHGGALPAMMTPFKMGMGGKLGSGRQWMSWVALDDVVGIICRALDDESFSGAVNVVAPEAIRNSDFTKALAHAMHRPAIFAAPAFVLRLALGEMADAALLASERVVPEKLTKLRHQFLHPKLDETLQHLLN
jgi:hypothetical protein